MELTVPDEYEGRASRYLAVYDQGCIVGQSLRAGIEYMSETFLACPDVPSVHGRRVNRHQRIDATTRRGRLAFNERRTSNELAARAPLVVRESTGPKLYRVFF